MTEQEAVERLKCMRLFMQIEDDKNECKFLEDDYIANDMAIKALEEQIKIKMLGKRYIIPKNGVWEVNGVDIHKAIEKQIPKKPFKTMDENNPYYKYMPWCCPCCRETLYEDTEWGNQEFAYCTDCGQKLNWEEV